MVQAKVPEYYPCYLDAQCHDTGRWVVTSNYSQFGGKMPLVPISAVAASQARPQETGLSALWAKMVSEALLKLFSGGFSLLLEGDTDSSWYKMLSEICKYL